ncbi:Hypothetical_protein [Hexamita inflata]|uniref:Hypothetical_protein n=1 Tax=Hexamita inflata TaxID=28002 RepID=A0AA86R343_9EUKA|nr:Hypothetical protein HINF_LOCUS58459 [Hexamita inflata]
MNVQNVLGWTVGHICGFHRAKNCSVQNVNISSGNLKSHDYLGGIFGWTSSNSLILNTSILRSNISGSVSVGGFIGYCQESKIVLQNSTIYTVRLVASQSYNLIMGSSSTMGTGNTFSISNSSSSQNYINNNQISDCGNIINMVSQNGC